jgi:superfamily I DNA/RNA helicase
MLKRLEYSDYQLDIFDAVENGDENIAINAVAGSGKTTTIVSACRRLKENERNVIFLAFNKLIVEELKTKLKGYAEVSTLHAFGFHVLKKFYNHPQYKMFVRVDDWKYQKYVRQHVLDLSNIITPSTDAAKVFGFSCNVAKLYSLARVNLIQYSDKDLSKLRELCDEHNLITLYDEVEVCNELLKTAYKMPQDLVIDYTDMIVLPLFHKEAIPTYKYVFIDECQDLNRAQRELMLCAAKNGRFIAVGDRNQAINGFAGADCNSFDKIANQENTIELPLSVNYRCGTNMIALAQEIVPQIKPHKGAIKGEIYHTKELTKSLFRENDMVLCRTSAPLVGLCMKLIESGITAVVKGKDIAQDLKNLIENANTKNIQEVLKYLEEEKQKMINVIKEERKCDEAAAKNAMKYLNLEDRCKCIENICMYSIKDTTQLKSYINKMFTDDKIDNAVMLSTAHKSKGLEANRVLILLPNKLPLKYPQQKEWQEQQEWNLKYVAITRARKELIFVDLTEQELLKKKIIAD